MTMLSVAITSALLGIAAIVIRKLFGNRTGIKPFIIMWAVVFIKFAVPVELPSHLSVMNLFARSASTAESVDETPAQNDYFPGEMLKFPRRKRKVPFILSKVTFP